MLFDGHGSMSSKGWGVRGVETVCMVCCSEFRVRWVWYSVRFWVQCQGAVAVQDKSGLEVLVLRESLHTYIFLVSVVHLHSDVCAVTGSSSALSKMLDVAG